MKKSLLAVAVLGAFAGAASAQSSVTLFGVVDLSANYIKNGNTSIKSMNSDMLNSNRLGFRGTEDLGGGLLAGFWLEGGMAPDTGTATGFNFTRRSTVSLTSKMGEIRLGRDYTNSFSTVATFDAYGANGMGSPISLYLSAYNPTVDLGSGATTTVRANNVIGYFLPSGLGGLYGSLQAAFGEGIKGNEYVGGRLGYAAGPFDISATVAETDVAAASKYKNANVGASYNLGVAKVMGFIDQRKFGSLKYTTYSISTSVPLGQGEFRLAYSKGNADGGTAAFNASDATLIGAEYIYNLSKRTALYTQYGRLENKGGTTGSRATMVGTGPAMTSGGLTATGYGVGVRHSF
jgi:predicted porin